MIARLALSFAASARFGAASRQVHDNQATWPMRLCACAGALVGALLLTRFTAERVATVAPWGLLLVTLLPAAAPLLTQWTTRHREPLLLAGRRRWGPVGAAVGTPVRARVAIRSEVVAATRTALCLPTVGAVRVTVVSASGAAALGLVSQRAAVSVIPRRRGGVL